MLFLCGDEFGSERKLRCDKIQVIIWYAAKSYQTGNHPQYSWSCFPIRWQPFCFYQEESLQFYVCEVESWLLVYPGSMIDWHCLHTLMVMCVHVGNYLEATKVLRILPYL